MNETLPQGYAGTLGTAGIRETIAQRDAEAGR